MKKVSYFLSGMLIPLLFANCTGKSSQEEAENLLHVKLPQMEKFVVITAEEAPIYKEADTNSPTLLMCVEDCECDMPEVSVQWSDQQVPQGFSNDSRALFAGQPAAVVGEEGDFYRITTLDDYSDVETGYILKSATEDIKPEPVTAELAETEEWAPTLVVKEGKYKNLVLRTIPDELNGERMEVGVLVDGVLAFPCNYVFDIWMDNNVEGMKIDEMFSFRYSEDMVCKNSDGYMIGFDPKKLSEEQIGQIFEYVTKTEVEQVKYEYNFPMLEGTTFAFWFKTPATK